MERKEGGRKKLMRRGKGWGGNRNRAIYFDNIIVFAATPMTIIRLLMTRKD